jgi:hypothetical protein
LPRIASRYHGLNTLDTLAGAKWFLNLDLKRSYWQVALHPDDKEKTALCIVEGLWQLVVLFFSLCNTPATLERKMESVLSGLTFETYLVYLDDVIVVERTSQKETDILRKVFQRFQGAQLRPNAENCQLFQDLRYLGHISLEGVTIDPEKL